MSQWTKGKFKHRGPPPALFSHSSPAASTISLAGGDNSAAGTTFAHGQAGNVGSGTGHGLGVGNSTASGGAAAASRMPSLPTLQRTTSRLRQEVSNGPGGGGGAGGGTSSGGSGAPAALSTHSSEMHGQMVGQSDLLQVGGSSGKTGGPSATPTGKTLGTSSSSTTTTAGGKPGVPPPTTAFTLPLPLRHASSTRATDRTDALWAEMQATLEEVELSASEGTRVFGPDHDHKLAALRQAQIALAQAWAHSEADEAGGISGEGGGLLSAAEGELSAHNLLKATTTTGTSMSGAGGAGKDDEASASGLSRERGGGGGGGGLDGSAATHSRDNVERYGNRPLEEETQVDILLARKRREANDRYFQRVNRGVLDVVAKLEDVADAMREVEQESMDIWGGENEGEPPASMVA
ncbi:hypothetical protein SCUCBS95973_000772 [Sporothrix curviconia]|uniref:Uncharacterized protein n=1 Tax=Sporothrix curviconia TaxID=1260050 RepID=A0ABP0AT19_9PEZI